MIRDDITERFRLTMTPHPSGNNCALQNRRDFSVEPQKGKKERSVSVWLRQRLASRASSVCPLRMSILAGQ